MTASRIQTTDHHAAPRTGADDVFVVDPHDPLVPASCCDEVPRRGRGGRAGSRRGGPDDPRRAPGRARPRRRTPAVSVAATLPALPDDALRAADVVVCATSARSPLFDSALRSDDVVVIAVGSHEPDARELDARLLGRATVVVEDVATALREARDVVTGTAPTGRPLVFKSVGMAWQDLVVAEAVRALG